MHADVVVVGAGAAGCVIADRLSERSSRTVLLLEAGTEGPVVPWPNLLATRTTGRAPAPYLRGRGLGGSAALNSMVANLGEPDDYDEWERAYGCVGWGWREARLWFRRARLPMRRPRRREVGPLSAAVLSSTDHAQRARLTRTADGRRASVKEVYLDPARCRSNLGVRSNAIVDRVLFDGHRAVGVRLADGEVIDAKTVVVCAGALHTPAVLLRSGVEREGVGLGLHDHPSVSLPLTMRGVSSSDSVPVSVVAHASHRARNDVQLIPFESDSGAALMAAAMRVFSRGRVSLAAADPTIDPLVDFNMFADERDLELLRVTTSAAVRVANTDAVLAVASPAEVEISDDWLLSAAGEYVHAAGSCRMGATDDSLAVVDNRCQVIGYESLRVCDASVMPNLPRANPCLPTVMIAERVAAMMDAQLRDK